MNQYLSIQDKHREQYNEAWARKIVAARSDIPQDPRSLYKCLDSWSKEYTQAAASSLKLIRIQAERGTLTPSELEDYLASFQYFRHLAHVYLAARNSIYREVCEAAEKMQAFVKSGCKTTWCDACSSLQYTGDPHNHDSEDYYLEPVGRGRGYREDFHADER